MSRPSGVARSSPRLRFPRFECSISTWMLLGTMARPVDARPRIASPRSTGSILITSAPQSASSADAAGTKVCSATSRTRTPFITSVIGYLSSGVSVPGSGRHCCTPPPAGRRDPMQDSPCITTSFPDDFLWGAATAPHQVEGGNVNSDMWEMEWATPSIFAEPSGDACDHYHRYPEDVALLADLGFNAYRFGVEWARIEPEEGSVSRAELDHYRRLCP